MAAIDLSPRIAPHRLGGSCVGSYFRITFDITHLVWCCQLSHYSIVVRLTFPPASNVPLRRRFLVAIRWAASALVPSVPAMASS